VSSRRPWATAVVVWLAVLLVGAATAVLRFPVADALATSPTVGSGRLERPEVAAAPASVLPELPAPARAVDPDAVAARLAALPADGVGDIVALVVEPEGAEVYRAGSGVRTPASSLKVLTALVALDVLGPDRRFATTVVRASDGGVVLRGGGDPLLASARASGYPDVASLEDLAAGTAAALTAAGVREVALGYDATLFGGPAWNPEWPQTFATSVAPVSALTADHARPDPTRFARHPDPARFAAERFAGYLAAAGVAVTATGPAATPAGATELARVESPPVATLVEQLLLESDNDAAETLARHVALAGGGTADPAGAASALERGLRARGLWTDGMVVRDASGIAATNQVSAEALTGAVRAALAEPRLRPVATGLPVAAVTGTLDDRFDQPDADAGRGVVRAKTGTIRGVNTLTGYLITRDGQPLVFAFLVSGGAGQTSARAWLDRAAAALASCGC